MSKKKGLGQQVEKSIIIMDSLKRSLKDFAHMPLKKGLVSNKTFEKDVGKLINEASEDAFALINKIDDLQHQVKSIKTQHNSRFAHKIVSRFLERSIEAEGYLSR